MTAGVDSVLAAAVAALCWGIGSYYGGRASRSAPPLTVAGWGSVLAILLLLPVLVGFEQGAEVGSALAWGGTAGVFALAGAVSLYRGLAQAETAVVAPLAGVLGAAIPVVGGTLLGERPAVLAWAGILLGLPAIWLLTAGNSGGNAGVLYGVLAGTGFGIEFIILAQSPQQSSLWPVAGAHLTGLALVALIAARGKATWRMPSPARLPALLAGVFNLAAFSAFLLATRSGLVSLTSVVASLYPAPTMAMAMVLDGQRARRPQLLGAGLALAAIALITAG